MLRITAKEKYRQELLEYLGDWENPFLKRIEMPAVLGIKLRTLYKHFPSADLTEIENEAMAMRKKHSSRQRSEVYDSMLVQALKGNTTAQKEFLDRTEGKVVERKEVTGKDGTNLIPELTAEEKAQLAQIINNGRQV